MRPSESLRPTPAWQAPPATSCSRPWPSRGALVWGVSRLPRRVRPVVAGALAVVLVTGVALQLSYPPLVDRHPAEQAATLRAAAPGTPVDLLINPAGWHMVLVRR